MDACPGGEIAAIDAIFHFVARNPPSIAIAGGVLMWLVGSLQQALGMGGQALLGPAPWVFGAGVVLQVLWLVLVPISRG